MVGKFLVGNIVVGMNMDTNMSLDDIIQKKFRNAGNKRGKRGGPGGRGALRKQSGGTVQNVKNIQTKLSKLGVSTRGNLQGRRGGRGGGIKPDIRGGDARTKIIQQKRKKISDAREKLGEIAKMTDARLKLNKLHGQGIGKTPLPTYKGQRMRGGITVQTGSNGQIRLTTNKAQRSQQQAPFFNSGRIASSVPNLVDNSYNLEDELANSPSIGLLRRTVHNTAVSAPAMPLYAHPRKRDSSAYTWRKPQVEEVEEIYESVAQPRPRTFQDLVPVRRSQQTNTIRMHTRDASPQPSPVWARHQQVSKQLKVTRPVQQLREEPMYIADDDEEDNWIGARASGVKSRLDAPVPVARSMGIFAAESKASAAATSSRAPVQDTYHRIIVSNLQKSVTNEDIRELFEDIGSLVRSKLVRPGTAEVIYRSRKDAMKAVDIYHNRQLDGEPMKCMLVNPRPLPGISQMSSSRTASNSHLRGVNKKSTVYPDMDTIHRALFK